MLTERLKKRCQSARPAGIAFAAGYRVAFDKPSKDGSAKAALCKTEGANALGVLFEISDADLCELDRAEGAPKGYTRTTGFKVKSIDNDEEVSVITYLAKTAGMNLMPYGWYLALVLAGATQHKLPKDYIEKFRLTKYHADPKSDRAACKEAIEVMAKSGFCDWKSLLL